MTDSANWQQTFSQLFHSAVEKYKSGHHQATGLVDASGTKFLRSIGYTEQEFFDFVEDIVKWDEPTLETALAIATVRRDYFLQVQKGDFSDRRIAMADLPSKDAQVEGIEWLPPAHPQGRGEAARRDAARPDVWLRRRSEILPQLRH